MVNVPEETVRFPNKLRVPAVVVLVVLNVPPLTVKFPSTFNVPAPAATPMIRVPALTVKSLATPMMFPFKFQLPPVPLIIKLL